MGARADPPGAWGDQSGGDPAEARDNVIDALREVLAVRFGTPPAVQDATDSESVELTIAA